MITATKIRPIEQHMIDTKGFYLAKVTMFSQDYMTGGVSDTVESYEGYIKESDCGIIWMIRPEANMRSNNKTTILTVSQRLISVERIAA
jgi:hypothetical protein